MGTTSLDDPYLNFWRAKRLCSMAARSFAIASRRIRAGLPADIALRRGHALQRQGFECWGRV